MTKTVPKQEPTLAALMRSLADDSPDHASELRARASAFEDAHYEFYRRWGTTEQISSEDFELVSLNMLATWRAARQYYREAQQASDVLPDGWKV